MTVEFVDRSQPVVPNPETTARESRQRWLGNVGGKATLNTISREEAARLETLSPEEAMRERRRLAAARAQRKG